MSHSARKTIIRQLVQTGVYDPPTEDEEPPLRLCIGCVSAACWAIEATDSDLRGAFCLGITMEHRDFLVQLMRFVTRAREPVSIGILDAHIRTIHEQCRYKAIDEDEFHGSLDPCGPTTAMLVEYIFSFLDGVITCTRILARRNPFATGGWPTSASDASPFGPQITVDALIDWWIKLDSTYGDIALDRFLSMLRPTLALAFVDRSSSFAEKAISTWHLLALKIIDGTSTSSDHRRFSENVFLLGTVAAIVNGGEGLTQRMFDGLESALFATLFLMVQAAEKLAYIPPHAIGTCALTFASSLRCDIPAAHFTRYLQFAREEIVRDVDTSNIYGIFHHDLHRPYRPRVCMRDGCDTRDTNENYMRRCGRCRIFVYCSPECQRASWTASYLPHRASCPKFQSLFQVADYNKSVRHFVRRCTAANVTAETLGELKFLAYSAAEGRPSLTTEEQIRAVSVMTSSLSRADILVTLRIPGWQ